MSENGLSNLQKTLEWMDENIENCRAQDQAILRRAGWEVMPYEVVLGVDIRQAFATHKSSGQIIEIELDPADESTDMWSEVLEALITRKSTLQERWDNSDLKKDLGL